MRKRPPRREAGFIIIFGWRQKATREGQPPVETTCPHCRQKAEIVGKVARTWVTLFFLPVAPISAGERFSECTSCHAQFRMTIEQWRDRVATRATPDFSSAIAVHNRLRDDPGNPALLHELMQTYLAMNEPREAVASARHFPKALEGSDACAILLGQAHLKLGDASEALRCAAGVLERHPTNAGALELRKAAETAMTGPAAGGASPGAASATPPSA